VQRSISDELFEIIISQRSCCAYLSKLASTCADYGLKLSRGGHTWHRWRARSEQALYWGAGILYWFDRVLFSSKHLIRHRLSEKRLSSRLLGNKPESMPWEQSAWQQWAHKHVSRYKWQCIIWTNLIRLTWEVRDVSLCNFKLLKRNANPGDLRLKKKSRLKMFESEFQSS